MDDLTLICDACRKPIREKTGFLWVDNVDVRTAQTAWENHKRATTDRHFVDVVLDEAFADARWQAHHAGCAPAQAVGAYSIPADRLRTWPDILYWTSHLMEKVWLRYTDWRHLLREVHGGTRRIVATVARAGDAFAPVVDRLADSVQADTD